jgi:hypothetical protein
MGGGWHVGGEGRLSAMESLTAAAGYQTSARRAPTSTLRGHGIVAQLAFARATVRRSPLPDRRLLLGAI